MTRQKDSGRSAEPGAKVVADKDMTIKDVAKKANVSIATVSRVLHNLTGYSEETRKKVELAIRELGYQPNALARGLVNKRTYTIGVLFPSVSGMFSSEILHGIEQAAQQNGYSVFVCNTDMDGARTLNYLQVLREKKVDGVIFSSEKLKSEYYEAIRSMNIPVVLVASRSEFPDVPFVKVDDSLAAYDAVKYLIGKGHREIAMLSGAPTDEIAGLPRLEGYRKALLHSGLEAREELVAYGDFRFDGGCGAMEDLLDRNLPITALFAASDEMAAAALSVAARRGIRVPEDLSVMGYDNLKLCEMTVPPLSTVQQPLYGMGRAAMELLAHRIEHGAIPGSRTVPHHVVERQTVKAILR